MSEPINCPVCGQNLMDEPRDGEMTCPRCGQAYSAEYAAGYRAGVEAMRDAVLDQLDTDPSVEDIKSTAARLLKERKG